MPARSPKIYETDRDHLARLGARLRQARKAQKVSSVAAAEAAGLSRVTVHRIEKGEPSVAMASWVALVRTLGLAFDLVAPSAAPPPLELPPRIRLAAYPQLRKLAWQLTEVEDLSPREALDLYERNWRHVDPSSLTREEVALIRALGASLGGGRLLV